MPLGMEVGLGPGDFVFDGTQLAPQKRHTHPYPIFGPCLLWSNGLIDQHSTWYGGKPRLRRRCVRWDRSSPPPLKGAQSPVFRGETARWMKTPLGREVDLGPAHIVLDGVRAPCERSTAAPSFRPMSIVATVAHLSYC